MKHVNISPEKQSTYSHQSDIADEVLNSIPIACYKLDSENNFVYVNHKTEVLLNKEKEELLGRNIGQLFSELVPKVTDAAKEDNFYSDQYILTLGRKDVSLSSTPTDDGGLIVLLTEPEQTAIRKVRTDSSLEINRSRELLKSIFDVSTNAVSAFKSIRNEQGEIEDFEWIFANEKTNSYRNGIDLTGKRHSTISPDAKQTGIFNKMVEVVEKKLTLDFEQHNTIDGLDNWFHIEATKLGDGLVVFYEDITTRKQAEQKLKNSQALLQSVLDTSLIGMSVFKAVRDESGAIRDFHIELVNKELERVTERTDLIGKFYVNEYPNVMKTNLLDAMIRVVETAIPEQIEYYYPYDGYYKWFTSVFVKLDDGLVASNLDITEQKRAELEKLKLEKEKLQLEIRQKEMITAQNQKIFQITLDTQEEERKRIAESLHNGLGQLLYGIKISMSNLELNNSETDYDDYQKAKQYTDYLLAEAIRECRRISHQLTPSILEDFGLKEAINDVCQHFNNDIKIDCEFTGLNKRLSKYIETTIYRTIQELVLNILKHAQADEALVKVKIDKKTVDLTVQDNGIGFNPEHQSDGIGLKMIRNKVKLLNGTFKITSGKEQGNVVSIRIPYTEE